MVAFGQRRKTRPYWPIERSAANRGAFFKAILSSALFLALHASPKTSARPGTVVPSVDSSHGGRAGAPFFVKGEEQDGTQTHIKKKPMKKNQIKIQSSVPVQHSHTGTKAAAAAPKTTTATAPAPVKLLPIDHDARALNRKLDTAAVIGLLRDTRPDLYQRAEIVGSWVWLSFTASSSAASLGRIN